MQAIAKAFYTKAKERQKDIRYRSIIEMLFTMKQSLTSIDQLISLKKYEFAKEIIDKVDSHIESTYFKFACAKYNILIDPFYKE